MLFSEVESATLNKNGGWNQILRRQASRFHYGSKDENIQQESKDP